MSHRPCPRPLSLSIAVALCGAASLSFAAEPEDVLPAVTVSASPLSTSSAEMAAPVTVLEDADLLDRRSGTLGETLADQPGVSASHFGAGASRPIIRGMDAARVKILSDGAEVQDASTISPDHAVALEPMLSRQIEILRGPAALLYGGGAIGGVVNVLDRKIPTAIPKKGYEGNVELRGSSAAREGVGAFDLTGGWGNFALHVEGVKRDAGDYRPGSGWAGGSKVEGSYNRTETGSIGASWIGARGYLGLAFTRQTSRYGLPGHDHSYEGCHPHGSSLHCPGGDHDHDHDHDHDGDEHHDDDHGDDHDEAHDHDHSHAHGVPYVDLLSRRWDLRGEYRDPLPGLAKVRLRAGFTDYRHHEIEDDSIATTFRNKARDGRIEFEHHPIAGFRGVFGIQLTHRNFSALGEEAYVEPTRTRNQAVFLLEEYRFRNFRFEFGVRHERQQTEVESAQPNRRHSGTSASAAATWRFAPAYSLGVSLSRAHRLPSAEELYANGLHLATRTYERGDYRLGAETSNNIDVSLRKHAGATTFSITAFHNRVDNYIYARTLDVHEQLRLIQYTQGDASFNGLEAQLRHRLNSNFDITVFGDAVRGRLDQNQGSRNLPRIPAYRFGTRLGAYWANWNGQLEWYRVAAQRHIADFESTTPGYDMVNLRVGFSGTLGGTPYEVFARLNNLTNKLAFNHASFIKDSAPLMGRNLMVGMRVSF
ncbi:MAG: TonB-dependent receptor [Burkholderiaceae bacterium]